MDIKEYISSGIIEAYVLGLATEEEVSILDCVRQKNPEVQQAILDAQLLLEDFATEQAIAPAPAMKDEIWSKIASTPIPSTAPALEEHQATTNEASENTPKVKKLPVQRDNQTLAIAATVLLALSIGGNIFMLREHQTSKDALDEAIAAHTQTEDKLSEANSRWELLQRPSVKTVALAGVESHPGLKAVVLWDTESANVYLTAGKLPQAPAGKQYQLWAIVDGQPVDAGILPLASEDNMHKMHNIPAAQAFAITLEKEGGSPTPTLSDLFVIGNI